MLGQGSAEARPSTDANPQRKEFSVGKTGGVYIPPFKLAQMMKECEDKAAPEYQRMTWDALRKSINGLVNKVNSSNIKHILPEIFSEVRFQPSNLRLSNVFNVLWVVF